MQNPILFYKEQLEELKVLLQKDKKKLNLLSLFRLLVFIVTGVLIYFFIDSPRIAILISVVGIVVFVILLKIYVALKTTYTLNNELKRINEEELIIAEGDYLERVNGEEFQDANHFFSSDIDLFGKGSLFQYLDRTGLKEGKEYLANMLTSNNITDIKERQEAIKELTELPKWRQKFTAIARMLNSRTKNNTITTWLAEYQSFIPKYFKWLPRIYGVVSVILFIAAFFKIVGFLPILILLISGLLLSGFFIKKVTQLSAITNRVKETIQQYALLLQEIEKLDFKTSLLKTEKAKIEAEKHKASEVFTIFSKHLDALDNRNNVFVMLFGNGFFLWDIKYTLKIEQWIIENKDLVKQWFTTVAFFDSFNSLASFSFNHPNFTYPKLSDNSKMVILFCGSYK